MANEVSKDVNKLKKSVAAIHSRPSREVQLVQRKLINVCLYHAYDELSTQNMHRIHIDTLHYYFGYTGNNWKLFNEAFMELQQITFTWDLFGNCITPDEDTSWQRVPFFSLVKWDKDTREFCWKFGEGIAEKFYLPEQFATIALEMQSRFNSTYSLVLYEQCIRYASNINGSRWFSIQDLKDIFGISKNKYLQFKDFSKRVLKPALKEINDISDLNVDVEYKKSGRSVAYIKFHINRDSNIIDIDPQDSEQHNAVRDVLLKEFDVTQTVVDNLLKTYELTRINDAIDYVRGTSAYKNKTANIGGYIVKAVREGYKNTQQIDRDKRVHKEHKANKNRHYEAIKEKVNNLYHQRLNDVVNAFIADCEANFIEEHRQRFLEQYPKEVQEARSIAKITKKWSDIFQCPSIASLFNNYLLNEFDEIKKKVGTKADVAATLSEKEQAIWFDNQTQ